MPPRSNSGRSRRAPCDRAISETAGAAGSIARLPDELLGEIFALVAMLKPRRRRGSCGYCLRGEEGGPYNPRCSCQKLPPLVPAAAAIACSEVCRRWRAAFFAAPALWRGGELASTSPTGDFFDPFDPPPARDFAALAAVLRRTSGLLQRVRIEGLEEERGRRGPQRLAELLAALGPQPPLLSAALELPGLECLPATLGALARWPALCELELDVPPDVAAERLAQLAAQLPALTRLRLSLGWWLELRQHGCADLRPLSRLTRLHELELLGAFSAAPPPRAFPALRWYQFASADWSCTHGRYHVDFWDDPDAEFEVAGATLIVASYSAAARPAVLRGGYGSLLARGGRTPAQHLSAFVAGGRATQFPALQPLVDELLPPGAALGALELHFCPSEAPMPEPGAWACRQLAGTSRLALAAYETGYDWMGGGGFAADLEAALPALAARLPGLQELALRGLDCHGFVPDFSQLGLTGLARLTRLSLQCCDVPHEVPPGPYLEGLRELRWDSCHGHGPRGRTQLPDGLQAAASLTRLELLETMNRADVAAATDLPALLELHHCGFSPWDPEARQAGLELQRSGLALVDAPFGSDYAFYNPAYKDECW